MLQSKESFLSDIQPLCQIVSKFVPHFNQTSNLVWLLKRQSHHAGRGSTSSFSQRRYSEGCCTVHYVLAVKVINYFAVSLILLCRVLLIDLVMFTSLWYEVKCCLSICVSCFPSLGYTNCFPLSFMKFVCTYFWAVPAYVYVLSQWDFP